MTLLATIEQLQELRGLQVDPTDVEVLRALEDASALFRALAHQTISVVEDDAVELEGNPGRSLYLPEHPVLDVSDVSIQTDCATEVLETTAFRWSRNGLVRLRSSWWGADEGTVRVTYSHGYEDVPADVVAVVCAMATRRLANPAGAISERIGEHDVTWSSTRSDGSAIGLSAEEQKVIQRYKPFR